MPGRYKYYDPIGELHYETLRYLQGLPPSAEAISATTANQQDGFPAYTSWTDPYGGGRSNTTDYACVKSNIVVVGDKNTHDRNRLPTPSAANNIPDIAGWRGVVRLRPTIQAVPIRMARAIPSPLPTPTRPMATCLRPATVARSSARPTGPIPMTFAAATDRGGHAAPRPAREDHDFRRERIWHVEHHATRSTTNQLFMAAKYGGFETDPSNKGNKPYNTKGNPVPARSQPQRRQRQRGMAKAGRRPPLVLPAKRRAAC